MGLHKYKGKYKNFQNQRKFLVAWEMNDDMNCLHTGKSVCKCIYKFAIWVSLFLSIYTFCFRALTLHWELTSKNVFNLK